MTINQASIAVQTAQTTYGRTNQEDFSIGDDATDADKTEVLARATSNVASRHPGVQAAVDDLVAAILA